MERIGRYQVERELGRGAMSIVYQAFDSRIDRHLAVKVLRDQYLRDVHSRQRFLREARAAGGLGHPNIVTVFDVGQADGQPYMAMELLQGDTLADRLEKPESLGLGEVLEIAIQLASALSYAHRQGVIHRDVKPGNVHYDAATGLVKLLDFGIAAIGHRPEPAAKQAALVVGTPAFMAPEQITGSAPDQRSDLYALGVVLYRMLSGRLPFDEANLDVQLAKVVGQAPPPLEPVDPETPVELVELTLRLMAKQPHARLASADEVLEELQDIRFGMEQGLLASARQSGSVWRWPIMVGTLVAVVLIAGLSHVYHSQNRAMTLTTFGFGEGLASVVAREVAGPVLLEDSVALNNLVTDFAGNPQVVYLHVSDRSGLIQASTHFFLQGEPLPRSDGAVLRREEATSRILGLADGNLEFQVPVRFQGRRIGEVYLGLDGSEIVAAARSALVMMVLVFAAAMGVILVAMVGLVRRQRRLIERMAWGLRRIAKGLYDFRLESERRDEFGTLYRRFNDMATRLEERHGLKTPALDETGQRPKKRVDKAAAGIDPTMELVDGDAAGRPSNVTRFPKTGGHSSRKPPE